jgi:coenzyme F420-reducing hydrogenase delta subunit
MMAPRTETLDGREAENFKPEIVVLFCQHCIVPDADLTIAGMATSRFKAKLVMMPCSSKIEPAHLLKILAEGADGIQVLGCPHRQCRRLDGNLRAEKRIEYVRQLLHQIRLGAERLGMERGLDFSGLQLMLLAERRANAVKPLGRNPMPRKEN